MELTLYFPSVHPQHGKGKVIDTSLIAAGKGLERFPQAIIFLLSFNLKVEYYHILCLRCNCLPLW